MSEVKTFRFENTIFDTKKKFFEVPAKCLTLVIVNGGTSTIQINEAIDLAPNQAFSFPQHAGYYLKQKIKIQPVTGTGGSAASKVRIRMSIEN